SRTPASIRSTARTSRPDSSADEVDDDGAVEGADRLAAPHQLADRLAALLAVVLRQFVHVHGDETVTELRVEPAADLECVGDRLVTIGEPGRDRFAEHFRQVV